MGRLKRGDIAPDFTRDSVNMGRVALGDYRGQEVLLNFSRYFGCPVCQLEFDELLEFRRTRPDLRVIYVNQSLPDSAQRYLEGRGVDFPVIAAEKSGGGYPLYDLYGVGGLSLVQDHAPSRPLSPPCGASLCPQGVRVARLGACERRSRDVDELARDLRDEA